jgi:hypothetical protein
VAFFFAPLASLESGWCALFFPWRRRGLALEWLRHTKAGAAALEQAGIDDPAGHFKDKKIHATGTVKEVDKVPRIEIDDAKQLRLAASK